MLLSQKKASCVRCSLVLQTKAALLCFFSLQIAWHFKGRKFTSLNMQWTGKKKQLLCNTLRDGFVEPYVIRDPFSVPSTKILFVYGQSCDPFWVLVPYLKSLAEVVQTSALPKRRAGVAVLLWQEEIQGSVPVNLCSATSWFLGKGLEKPSVVTWVWIRSRLNPSDLKKSCAVDSFT